MIIGDIWRFFSLFNLFFHRVVTSKSYAGGMGCGKLPVEFILSNLFDKRGPTKVFGGDGELRHSNYSFAMASLDL
jgi:hypothetical protein